MCRARHTIETYSPHRQIAARDHFMRPADNSHLASIDSGAALNASGVHWLHWLRYGSAAARGEPTVGRVWRRCNVPKGPWARTGALAWRSDLQWRGRQEPRSSRLGEALGQARSIAGTRWAGWHRCRWLAEWSAVEEDSSRVGFVTDKRGPVSELRGKRE